MSLDAREWCIPASRMKAGVEHRVPLSVPLIEVLFRAGVLDGRPSLVFPSQRTIRQTVVRHALNEGLEVKWTSGPNDRTRTPISLPTVGKRTDNRGAPIMELSLVARSISSSVAQAYARSDLPEERRRLMNDWASFHATTGPERVTAYRE